MSSVSEDVSKEPHYLIQDIAASVSNVPGYGLGFQCYSSVYSEGNKHLRSFSCVSHVNSDDSIFFLIVLPSEVRLNDIELIKLINLLIKLMILTSYHEIMCDGK